MKNRSQSERIGSGLLYFFGRLGLHNIAQSGDIAVEIDLIGLEITDPCKGNIYQSTGIRRGNHRGVDGTVQVGGCRKCQRK